jgi:CspA family cold shock protein
MPNGKVKWFHARKGYGFISQDDGTEVFVHFSEIKVQDNKYKTLEQDQSVTFEVADGKNGLYAKNVVPK